MGKGKKMGGDQNNTYRKRGKASWLLLPYCRGNRASRWGRRCSTRIVNKGRKVEGEDEIKMNPSKNAWCGRKRR